MKVSINSMLHTDITILHIIKLLNFIFYTKVPIQEMSVSEEPIHIVQLLH